MPCSTALRSGCPRHRFCKNMLYSFLRIITIGLLKVFFRFKVEGIENLPEKTNFVVVANHSSFLDPVVLGAAIPQQIYWIALRSLFNKGWLRFLMKVTETVPTGGSSDKAVYYLNKNKEIGIFPEGDRSPDGTLKEFRRGAALLALRTGRPIVPCAIIGTYEALPWPTKFPKFVPIKIKIGQPIFLLKEFDNIVDDVALQEGTLKIRNAIKEMLDAG